VTEPPAASIVIRTMVDSGSTDRTLEIARMNWRDRS